MGIGVSIFLFAIGAILAFAVETQAKGINLSAVGVILMIVGGVGLLLSLLFWSSYSPWRREETIVREEQPHSVHHH